MDTSARYIVRLIFQNKIYSSDGNEFERLFTQVMQYHNSNFCQIKPQGQFGDRKNDGFDRTAGTYYQVYAPENIKANKLEAGKKLVSDFNGLYAYWQKITPIKKFYYVINDKYKGYYPSLYENLQNIRNQYPNIEVEVFLSKDLEDIFLNLTEQAIINIIGIIPSLDNVDIEYGVMNDVIKHLLNVETNPQQEIIPQNPNFENKIIFNGLSKLVADYLKIYRINTFVINDFFELNSNFVKNDLRNVFSGLYNEALMLFADDENKNDKIFFYIREKSYPKHTVAIDTAIFTLMSYYFEYCDIFEIPVV
jgi:hypothetical protein